MKTSEKESLVKEVIALHTKMSVQNDKLYDLFQCQTVCEDIHYELFDKYIELVEEKLNDNTQMLSWYIFDNDCGKKNLTVTINNKKYKIGSIKKLLNVIEKLNDCNQ